MVKNNEKVVMSTYYLFGENRLLLISFPISSLFHYIVTNRNHSAKRPLWHNNKKAKFVFLFRRENGWRKILKKLFHTIKRGGKIC